MRRLRPTILSAFAVLILAGQAAAGPTWGVADSRPIGMRDGGARIFDLMNDVGLTENRVTVRWNPRRPTTIPRLEELRRAVQEATDHGISMVFSVTQEKARFLAGSPRVADRFAAFVRLLANEFPDVNSFVIGNEFNQPRFFQPQFDRKCRGFAGGAYMRVLAKAYDALHAVNPDITVITSVSPRGNDACKAKNNRSTSPVRFIHDMGVAYKALHRRTPVFDEFGIHIYPNQPTDSGTAQPVPDSQPSVFQYGQGLAALRPVKVWIGEIAWQVKVKRAFRRAYVGRENVRATTEARQARIYRELVRMMSCDPLVDGMLFFGLVDERNLGRFQAGLLRANWTKRPSYAAVKAAIARAENGCQAGAVQWHHRETVLGARVKFGKLEGSALGQKRWEFSATAEEEAFLNAGIYRVPSRVLSEQGRDAIVRALASVVPRPSSGPAARSPRTAPRPLDSRGRRCLEGTTSTGSECGLR